MIGECREIKYWEDMNGVSPRIGDYVLLYGYWGLRYGVFDSVSNRGNIMCIVIKNYYTHNGKRDYTTFYLDRNDFRNSEIISKFHPKYKEIK